jgi:putative membrane protein
MKVPEHDVPWTIASPLHRRNSRGLLETVPTATVNVYRESTIAWIMKSSSNETLGRFCMKAIIVGASLLAASSFALADSPDSSFFKNAAEGGLSEVELGQMAQQKATNPAVKEFGAMMVKDHTAANDKLKALAASKQVSLPDSPGMMQKASKTKLNMLSGDSFDKSYVKGMIEDHKTDIKDFQKEATEGKDPEARAFATATLPTLQKHLEKIQSIAASAGIKD